MKQTFYKGPGDDEEVVEGTEETTGTETTETTDVPGSSETVD
jgi:hypothetical protein